MAHESADTLKTNLQNAFGLPDHVWQTFHAWIDSVEERLGGGYSRTGEGEGQLQPEPGTDQSQPQPQPNPDQVA